MHSGTPVSSLNPPLRHSPCPAGQEGTWGTLSPLPVPPPGPPSLSWPRSPPPDMAAPSGPARARGAAGAPWRLRGPPSGLWAPCAEMAGAGGGPPGTARVARGLRAAIPAGQGPPQGSGEAAPEGGSHATQGARLALWCKKETESQRAAWHGMSDPFGFKSKGKKKQLCHSWWMETVFCWPHCDKYASVRNPGQHKPRATRCFQRSFPSPSDPNRQAALLPICKVYKYPW